MNTDKNSDSTSPASPDELALQSIARHQRRLKWLTAAAVVFWALAVIGTVGVLTSYAMFVAPKERQIMNEYGARGRLSIPSDSEPQPTAPTHADKALGVNFTMTYVITKGILIVAVCVAILSLGTLATLLLTIFNRRITLRQINHSLAQISQQLKELKGT
jgi:hypothetical protein